jgi:hypothetical protein
MACWGAGSYPSYPYPAAWQYPPCYPSCYSPCPGLYGSWGGYPCWNGYAPAAGCWGGASYPYWYGAGGGCC